MTNQELFQAALGLTDPWRVASSEFDAAAHRLDLYLDFARGARFPCPMGDEASCPVHDTTDKTWRHLDFFQHQAYLHARVPRVDCPAHGVHLADVPWARPDTGFTLLFEALLMAMLAEMPVKAVADVVGEWDTRLWRVVGHYVSRARDALSMEGVTKVGIDETSARRHHDYITVFVDLDARRVLFATEGKNAATLGRFAKDLVAHGGDADAVADVCCDLSNPFVAGVKAHLPNAAVTFDRYHLAQLLSLALDQVRRVEAKAQPELLAKTRYLWLHRPDNLSEAQAARLAYVLAKGSTLKTARAYGWRLRFDAFFNQPAELAGAYLEAWWRGAVHSRLEPIVRFAHTVRDHFDGILRWHTTRISNGILEATNSLIQAAKRRARGYRTKANLITMTYLIAGKLDLAVTHTK
jgi:transposase